MCYHYLLLWQAFSHILQLVLLSSREFMKLDDKYAILNYVSECPDIFDSMNGEEMVEHNSELDTDSKPENAAEKTHAPDASSHSSWMVSLIVNVARLLLSLTFIFSGFVKAVDPIGTQYKIEDYAEAAGLVGVFPDWMTLTASVLISALEFSLGVFLLFAIKRRTVSKVILAFMVVMTAITAWLWLANPVSDCGCFGDAIHLTNGETFADRYAFSHQVK